MNNNTENNLTNSIKPFGCDDTMIIYILYGLGFLSGGLLLIAALIYAYVRRNDLKDTIYYSHLNYIIRTCWWVIGLSFLGSILLFVIVGIFVLIGVSIWAIYRGIKGFIRFKDGQAI